jgi:STE24 endopeptidase
MPLLLSLLLAIACLPIDWRRSPWGLTAIQSTALAGFVVLSLLILSRIATQRTLYRLEELPDQRERVLSAHGSRRFIFFFLNLGCFFLLLVYGGWGWAVRQNLVWNHRYLPGAELVILAPYLIVLVGSWGIFYDAELAIHRSRHVSTRPETFWSRSGYILYLSRQQLLIVFTPILLLVAQMGLMRLYPQFFTGVWAKLLGLGAMIFVFILLPSFVPLILGLRRMPSCETRDRLESTARRLRVRYRGLYLWDTRMSIATAMVAGLIPQFRNIVFTDLLLKGLNEEEVEGVFGHEVGHVKHGHLPYYAVFLFLSLTMLAVGFQLADSWHFFESLPVDLFSVITLLGSGVYLFTVFGFLSRRCERQADVFGCRTMSCDQFHCPGHLPSTKLVPEGKGLCQTGIRTFIHALKQVEEINGMSRSTRDRKPGLIGRIFSLLHWITTWLGTWQHSTIAKRIAFLELISLDPSIERRFQRRVTLWRWGLLIGIILLLIIFTRAVGRNNVIDML